MTPIQAVAIKALRAEYFRKYNRHLSLSEADITEAIRFVDPRPWEQSPDLVEMLDVLENPSVSQ